MPQPHTSRRVSRGTTIVPFPGFNLGILIASKAKQLNKYSKKFGNKATKSKGPRVFLRTAKQLNFLRLQKTHLEHVGKNFTQIKNIVEAEIFELLSFLPKEETEARSVFIKNFDRNVRTGKIRSVEQLYKFLDKAKELARCLKLCLEKNEYSEHFMNEISFDVFEKGFSPKNQDDIRNRYTSYFDRDNS